MTHHNDTNDFDQFAGRFDAPVAPSPAFAASLMALMAPASGARTEQPASATPVPALIPAPAVAESDIDETWRAPRWMRTIEVAVACLIVVSLLTASIAFRQPTALWDLAFQPTPEPSHTEVNFAGNPGRTWDLGKVVPETGKYRVDPKLDFGDGQYAGDFRSLLVEDSIIYVVSGSAEYRLVRYDLAMHEQVWSVPIYVTGSMASDGERIYGTRFIRPTTLAEAPGRSALSAIDFKTGAVIWDGPELADRFYSSNTVALEDDVVYATDYLGNTVAVSKVDGTKSWQYPETFAIPAADEDSIVEQSPTSPPELAINGSAVFVSQPSKAVVKLDKSTGELIDSINLVDRFGADIIHPAIQATDNMLVITAVRAGRQVTAESDDQYYPALLMVFDPNTLKLRSTSRLADYRGNTLVTDDSVFVVAPSTPTASAWLYKVDLETGDLGSPIGNQSTKSDMLLSASGTILMIAAYPATITFYDLDTLQMIASRDIDASHMETPFSGPIRMWGANPIVITGMGDVYVVTDESSDP